MQQNRLYVGNLSYNTTADGLRAAFAECGNVDDAHVVTDRETGRARGFAFVTMGTDAAAQEAVSRLNGALLDGRALKVNIAEPKTGGGGGGGGGRGGFGGGGRSGGHKGW